MYKGAKMDKKGFSLLEMMLALSILSIALAAMIDSMVSTGKLESVLRDKRIVRDGINRVINDMRSCDFATMTTTFATSFDITDIRPQTGQAHVGTVTFYTDETGAGMTPDDMASLGFPRDLNANGNATDTDVTNYVILPAKIEVKWNSGSDQDQIGYSSYTHYCIFATQTQ